MKKNIKTVFAFTLAEVLITLGIIGIVAEMTIPTLILDSKKKATISKVKKIYSILSQSYKMSVQENGTPDNWELTIDSDGSRAMVEKFTPFLKVTKDCGTDEEGCFGVGYYRLGGNFYTDYTPNANARILLADGMGVIFVPKDANCKQSRGDSILLNNVCGVIEVDINGPKEPNILGRDLFSFVLSKYGIVPAGTANANTNSFSSGCQKALTSATTTGLGCAAWVMYNENMDYLKCSDLSWSDKSKCNN